MILCVGIEFLMRAVYPELRNPMATEVSYDGITWYQINRSYLRKYFSSTDYLVPEFKPNLFRKEKAPQTFRVLCLGESSMFGVPYQMTANIPGIVRKQLRHLYPEKEIEVLNMGASAINTNAILDFSRDLLSFHPDLVLVYTGHNEFYGPDGVGASTLEKQFPFLTPLKYSLADLRIISLLRTVSKGDSARAIVDPDFTLMKQVSQNSHVALHSADADRIFSHFEKNLTKIIGLFKGNGIPVIVSDVASNLSFPPFASASDEGTRAEKDRLVTAESLIASEKFEEAVTLLRETKTSDSSDARYHFLLGKALQGSGISAEAKRHLVLARDNDLLKFRAPERINAIIKKVCATEGVPLLSSDSLFAAQSKDGITGNDLFWEHLHPVPRGYYLIANLFVQEIERGHYIPRESPGSADSSLLPFNYDSLSVCWLDLAYGDISIRNLTSKWPFTNYSITPIVMSSADEELQRIVGDVYFLRAVWDLGCYEASQYFWKKGRWREAITGYEALLEEYPYNFYTHYLFASVLSRQKMIAEAVRHYEISITSNPNYPYSRLEVGLIKVNLGQFDEAIAQFSKASELATNANDVTLKANIFYGLAVAYANKREFQKALAFDEEALRILPGYSDAKLLHPKILAAAKMK